MKHNVLPTVITAFFILASCSSKSDRSSIDSEIYFSIAREYVSAGEPEKALMEIDKAINADPKNLAVYFLKCETQAGIGRFDEAFKTIENLDKRLPAEKKYLKDHWLGVVYFHKNDLAKAAEHFITSSLKSPDFAGNYQSLGQVYTLLREPEKSIENYVRWTALEPESDHAWGQLGIAYVSAKMFDKAKEALDKALAINKTSAEAYNYLGTWAMEQNRWSEAETYFKKSIKLNSSNPFANLNYGQYLMLKNRSGEAYPYLKKAYDLKPDVVYTLFWLGKYRQLKKEYKEAYRLFERAVELDPSFWAARRVIADVSLESGEDVQKTVKIMQDGIANDPHNQKAYLFYIARLKLEQNDPEAALDYANKTLTLLDKSAVREIADVHNLKGRIYEKLGQPDKAGLKREKVPSAQLPP
ncbi:MAG: hypothetical protein IEMM0002_1290 [bacterium]|nr:MAG: hypothetical protein IEMM0002_1290 [bacterium]